MGYQHWMILDRTVLMLLSYPSWPCTQQFCLPFRCSPNPDEASKMGRNAFEDAIAELVAVGCGESKVFYQKMKAVDYRYIAEFIWTMQIKSEDGRNAFEDAIAEFVTVGSGESKVLFLLLPEDEGCCLP